MYGEPATLDPYSPLASDLTRALVRPLYPSLFRMTPEGAPEPYLAASIDSEGPSRTTLVELADIRWSDGREVSATDVVKSVRRAGAPSGFAGLRARAAGDDRVTFRSRAIVRDWEERLATAAFVLPGGRAGRVYGGPFVLASRTAGLQVAYRPNPEWEGTVVPERVTVRFTIGTEMLLALLEGGRLDAAAIPSTVNLGQRLREIGIDSSASLGWEVVLLEMDGDRVPAAERATIARVIDRAAIETGFVRDEGRVADTVTPGPGRAGAGGPFRRFLPTGADIDGELQLAAPTGDELLEYTQRMIQVQLRAAGADVELVSIDPRTYYGAWETDGPFDLMLTRRSGGPGVARRDDASAPETFPLVQVETVIAWRPGLLGAVANPTLDGPLWNLEGWFLGADGSD